MKLLIFFALVSFSIGSNSSEPNHLVPISPYDPTGYQNAVFESLIVNGVANAYMISLPSFSPEEAVILYSDTEYLQKDGKPVFPVKLTKEEWFVKSVIANKMIHQTKIRSDGAIEYDIRPTKDVVVHIAKIEKNDAQKIISAWKKVLQGTRYYDEPMSGFDGTNYLFYTGHELYGKAWSPDSGIPKMLVDLGNLLSEYARSEEKDRGQIMQNGILIADKILSHPEN